MRVKQLIEVLQEMNPDLPVRVDLMRDSDQPSKPVFGVAVDEHPTTKKTVVILK